MAEKNSSFKSVASVIMAAALTLSPLHSLALVTPSAFIDQDTGGFSLPFVVVDGQTYSASPWTGAYNLEDAFSENVAAAEMARLHTVHSQRAYWGAWGSLLGAVAFFSFTNEDSRENQFLPALGIILAGSLYSGYQANLSRSYLFRSMNIYNGILPATATNDITQASPKLMLRFSW